MRRHLFNFAAAASLVLWAAALGMWARSYTTADSWVRLSSNGTVIFEFEIHSQNGRIGYEVSSYGGATAPGWRHVSRDSVITTPPYWFTAHGPPHGSESYADLAIYTGVLPLWWFVRRHFGTLTRRRRAGQCLECGYDLRASPGRCPECGTVPRHVRSAPA